MVVFKSLPAEVRTYINEECPWRFEASLQQRPSAPPPHRRRQRPGDDAPSGPTFEQLAAQRAAEARARKLAKQRAKEILSLLGVGQMTAYAFATWHRNVRRTRTFLYRRERMRWIYARFNLRGRDMSAALLGWLASVHARQRQRMRVHGALRRWRMPPLSRALNRWLEFVAQRRHMKDLMRRVAQRMMNSCFVRCFAAWVLMVADKHEHEAKLRGIMALMSGNSLYTAFHTWRDNVRILRSAGFAEHEEVRQLFLSMGGAALQRSAPRRNRTRAAAKHAPSHAGTSVAVSSDDASNGASSASDGGELRRRRRRGRESAQGIGLRVHVPCSPAAGGGGGSAGEQEPAQRPRRSPSGLPSLGTAVAQPQELAAEEEEEEEEPPQLFAMHLDRPLSRVLRGLRHDAPRRVTHRLQQMSRRELPAAPAASRGRSPSSSASGVRPWDHHRDDSPNPSTLRSASKIRMATLRAYRDVLKRTSPYGESAVVTMPTSVAQWAHSGNDVQMVVTMESPVHPMTGVAVAGLRVPGSETSLGSLRQPPSTPDLPSPVKSLARISSKSLTPVHLNFSVSK
jgi:hypothetical protein